MTGAQPTLQGNGKMSLLENDSLVCTQIIDVSVWTPTSPPPTASYNFDIFDICEAAKKALVSTGRLRKLIV